MDNKSYKNFIARAGALVVLVLISSYTISQQKLVDVSKFSTMSLAGWDQKSFSGETLYQIDSQTEAVYLTASSDNAASALYKKIKVDLNNTPYLNWSWRIDNPLPELNEQTKAGDDYSARIYVIVKRGFAPWNTKALNYIWSSNQSPEQSWPNAFTDKAMMIPLRSSLDATQEWFSEKINVRLDFEKYFGIHVETIDGIAIMVDSDNSGLKTAASFGDVYFSSN